MDPNQQYPQQAPPGAPGYPAAMPAPGNGLAVASMVLGIIALVLCWIWFLAGILGLLALIFGGVGIGKANRIGGRGKGMAIAGLVCGILSMILAAVIVFLFVRAVDATLTSMRSSQTDLTKIAVDKISSDWFNRWMLQQTDKACPDDLLEVARAVKATEDDIKDPWGSPYQFKCGSEAGLPNGLEFGVWSLGEDKKDGTADDIKSWERFHRR